MRRDGVRPAELGGLKATEDETAWHYEMMLCAASGKWSTIAFVVCARFEALEAEGYGEYLPKHEDCRAERNKRGKVTL